MCFNCFQFINGKNTVSIYTSDKGTGFIHVIRANE